MTREGLTGPTADAPPRPTAGRAFAEALGRKDFAAIADLLDPEIDFRGMTPRRNWEATSAEAVLREILPVWFEPSDEIEAVESVETGVVADRDRVAYRFRVRNADGSFVVEQQAYYSEQDGRINWMRVLCSGFRPR